MDHVVDPLVAKIAESVKKKNKGGMELRPFQIKSHMWIFVNCLIENPAFDSQTKENMTLKQSAFGSKFEPTDKFVKDVRGEGRRWGEGSMMTQMVYTITHDWHKHWLVKHCRRDSIMRAPIECGCCSSSRVLCQFC